MNNLRTLIYCFSICRLETKKLMNGGNYEHNVVIKNLMK